MRAVILAAGIGKRLADKYLLLINNKTLIEQQYYKLREYTDDISVVYNNSDIKNLHQHLDVKWINNISGDKQNSIKLAINSSKSTCLIVLADMINVDYKKYFDLDLTTFSYNKVLMPPVIVNYNDFDTINKSDFKSLKDILNGNRINISNYEVKDIDYFKDVIEARKTVVVISGGDLASATINKLAKAGYNVIVVEKTRPLAVRRLVSYSEAMYDKQKHIDDVTVVKCISTEEVENTLLQGNCPIISNITFQEIRLDYHAIIDVTLRKKSIKYQGFSIGVGPGFRAPDDVTYVIESMRGESLGKVIRRGSAIKNTKIPSNICGFDVERVLYSPIYGVFESKLEIGEYINKGDIFGWVDNSVIYAKISGIIRGQIRNGTYVKSDEKIGDINPIENNVDIKKFSDKSLTIADSILTILEEEL